MIDQCSPGRTWTLSPLCAAFFRFQRVHFINIKCVCSLKVLNGIVLCLNCEYLLGEFG